MEQIFDIIVNAGYWSTLAVGGAAVIISLAKKDLKGATKRAAAFAAGFGGLAVITYVCQLLG